MPIVSPFPCGQGRLGGVKQMPKSARVSDFHIDNQEDHASRRLLRTYMAAGCHRLQAHVQTFTLPLPTYDHGRGLRGRWRYHGGANLYSRRHRVAVSSALRETPGSDRSAILTAIVIRSVVMLLLWTDIIKNHPQQLSTGSFQKPF